METWLVITITLRLTVANVSINYNNNGFNSVINGKNGIINVCNTADCCPLLLCTADIIDCL